jgi:hypothetical protein
MAHPLGEKSDKSSGNHRRNPTMFYTRLFLAIIPAILFLAGSTDNGMAGNTRHKPLAYNSNSIRTKPVARFYNGATGQFELQRGISQHMRNSQLRDRMLKGGCARPPCNNTVMDKLR